MLDTKIMKQLMPIGLLPYLYWQSRWRAVSRSDSISATKRFGDCFGNGFKSNTDINPHRGADKPTLSDADYIRFNNSEAHGYYAYARTSGAVQLQQSRPRL